MTGPRILDEGAVSEIERDAESSPLATFPMTTEQVRALCATVKYLRARLDSIKSKTAWHRDGIGPDVPVLQERYDNLIAQRNDLQSQLEQLRAENEKLTQEGNALSLALKKELERPL